MGEESSLAASGTKVTYAWRKFEKNMEWNQALFILFSFEGWFCGFSVIVITNISSSLQRGETQMYQIIMHNITVSLIFDHHLNCLISCQFQLSYI
jgi:hypothetical protein